MRTGYGGMETHLIAASQDSVVFMCADAVGAQILTERESDPGDENVPAEHRKLDSDEAQRSRRWMERDCLISP